MITSFHVHEISYTIADIAALAMLLAPDAGQKRSILFELGLENFGLYHSPPQIELPAEYLV